MEPYDNGVQPIGAKERRIPLWLMIVVGLVLAAVLFHLTLLAVGAFWVSEIIREPEKKVDFTPSPRVEARVTHGTRVYKVPATGEPAPTPPEEAPK